ncbi:MAG: reverse transcriptase domain-containing protein [Sedimenticola sp.]
MNNKPDNFVAGKIGENYLAWLDITSDKWILDIVKNGYCIEFLEYPLQDSLPKMIKFNDADAQVIDVEIHKLLHKQVIRPIEARDAKFVSNIFIRPKRDGSHRLILNLRILNEQVEKLHFKMETLKSALALVTKDCFFALLDLRDAYFSVRVCKCCQPWLSFKWNSQYFCFTCLPNGLSSAPRVFTKLLKPLFSSLRKRGHCNSAYIDDCLLKSDTREECLENVHETLDLVDNIGFTVHPRKSVVNPAQEIVFVGFLINSVNMTVKLTVDKANEIIEQCRLLKQRSSVTIRELAKVIGKLVASEPAVPHAPLFYKPLEIVRDKALKVHRGNFDAPVLLTRDTKLCLEGWIDNVSTAYRPIILSQATVIIESDSSQTGFGAINKSTGETISGLWSQQEKQNHINYLELKAAVLALKQFCNNLENIHVKLYLDNTVAMKYLAKMGGRKSRLNSLARDVWNWLKQRRIWISVYYIPGKLNVTADNLSRRKNEDMEWMVNDNVFIKIQSLVGKCTIDLFASDANHRLPKYVSFTPDLNAVAVNAFSLTWGNLAAYLFPPFSVLGQVLQKIQQERATVVLIAPIFPTQSWFPTLLQLICHQPYMLPKTDECLVLPQDKKRQHPLRKMRLGVFKVSGKHCLVRDFQRHLPKSFCHPGGPIQRNSMGRISASGCYFVTGKNVIYLIPM